MKKITILTREVSPITALSKRIRNFLRFLKYFMQGGIFDTDIIRLGGHTAVTRSLLNGLKHLGTEYIYNPLSESAVSDTVVVLTDMQALRQAIEWKKNGKIKKLIAGPNLLDLPTKYNKALSAPEIDIVLVPSEWVKEVYGKLDPALSGKLVIWYAGVDTEYWKLANTAAKQKEILVYWKDTTPRSFCLEVESLIKKSNYGVNRIRYGHYNKKHYREMLRRSSFAVFLSLTESQGLALAESWAMNVPTLVWSPEMNHPYVRGIQASSAPYLSKATGTFWKELGELEALLANNAHLQTYAPSAWVAEHMSDEVSARMFLAICNNTSR